MACHQHSGFKKQLQTMFKGVRVVATLLLFASIAMTFVSAFVLPAILCIVFVIVQYLAFLWVGRLESGETMC